MYKVKKWIPLFMTAAACIAGIAACAGNSSNDDREVTPKKDEAKDNDGQEDAEAVSLTVLAAASLTDVLEELAATYKAEHPNVELVFSFGASGALQTQIEEGAPADLFLSAAEKQMDELEGKGLTADGTRESLLVNKVVLIKEKDSGADISSFEDLESDDVKTIALGEPEGVPVGQYSQEIFESMGVWDKIVPKANYGSDVRQVLTWVESGEVDCGVVYATDAYTSDNIEIIAEAPQDSHKAVIYPGAVIGAAEHPEEAKAFLEFLQTEEVSKVFENYGFTIYE